MIEQTVFADIHIEGGWPSPDDLISRNAILDELDDLALGQFMGCGDRMGSVVFSYRVANAVSAASTIEQLIHKHLPHREFTIDVSEN